MAGSYLTEDFVSLVRVSSFCAPTDDTETYPLDSDIIRFANRLMGSYLVPWILKAREGHFIQHQDIALASGQASYTIPSRASGDAVSLVQVVDSSGQPAFWPGLQPIELELGAAYPVQSQQVGQPARYYFEGNSIVLVPTPDSQSAGYFLRVRYPQRPNQLVPTTSVGVITGTSVVSGNYRVAYTGSPSGFTSTAAYEVAHVSPGFEVVPLGTANGTGSGYVQFAGTSIPSGLNVGDSLCLQDAANVLTYVPADLFDLFALRVAIRVLGGKRDKVGMESVQAELAAAEKMGLEFLKKRDMLSHRKISSINSRFWYQRPPFWVK